LIAEVLDSKIVVGVDEDENVNLSPFSTFLTHNTCFTTERKALISASVDDNTTVACCVDIHTIEDPASIMIPPAV
jgi:hypothetical protein